MIIATGAKVLFQDKLGAFIEEHRQIHKIITAYGQSETSCVAVRFASTEEYVEDPDGCGIIASHTEYKLLDVETGQALTGANKRGILHVKGPTIMPGYYDIRCAEKGNSGEIGSPFVWDSTIFDSDGFYITGDLAYFDQNDVLHFVGREKELMICRGLRKVPPQELEAEIEKHPAVAKVCVLGVSVDKLELLHCPRAFIVVQLNDHKSAEILVKDKSGLAEAGKQILEHKGNNQLSSLPTELRRAIAEDLVAFVDERVIFEKQLTGGIVILDEMPTGHSGKVDKSYLRSLSLDQIEIYGDRSC